LDVPFLFYCSGDLRDLHSFPTRRSSDLVAGVKVESPEAGRQHSRSQLAPDVPHIDAHKCWESVGLAAFPLQFHRDDAAERRNLLDRKSTRLNSSHVAISYAVFCLKKKT